MVRSIFASRTTVHPKDEGVRYRGSAGALDEDLLLQVFRDLAVVKPLFGWLPSGGVLRDQEKARSWAKWYCGYLHRYFRDSHQDNYRHVLLLVTDERSRTLNILSRLEPIIGEGSISFRAFVTRTSDDEYACFEY
jgi:hypothetical protein